MDIDAAPRTIVVVAAVRGSSDEDALAAAAGRRQDRAGAGGPMITVNRGEKYALCTLPIVAVSSDLPAELEIAPRVWVTRKMPIVAPELWEHWVGTVDFKFLEEAELFLFTKAASKQPEILDEENAALILRLQGIYWALVVDAPTRFEFEPVALTGANVAGELDVRQRQQFESYAYSLGTELQTMDEARLRRAVALDDAFIAMQCPPRFPRIGRAIFAFGDAMHKRPAWDRLHQAVRCIDGFIHTAQGSGMKQFKSRTELFVGPRHHALMEQLYLLRSATEHLSGWRSALGAVAETERPRRVCLHALQAETIARACMKHLARHPALWPHFDDDAALAEFWKLEAKERAALWGAPLVDLDQVARDFDRWYFDPADPTCTVGGTRA